MNDTKEFIYQEPRSMPVILLLDNSGSMSIDNNIGTLNSAVNEMIKSFQSMESTTAKISVAVISFGADGAKLVQELTDAKNISPINLYAGGCTPLGGAIRIAKGMLEDRSIVTSRSYRPTVVVVTDGEPNDDWESPLQDFKSTGRSSKCVRMAMGIGATKNSRQYRMLEEFVSDTEQVFCAADASGIRKFFKYVTMSTDMKTKSQDPNQPIPHSSIIEQVDDYDYDDEDDDESWNY